jgi:hypothetical protein
MVETKSITEQLAEFNKIIDYLANVDVNLEDEDKVLRKFQGYFTLWK